MTFSDCFFTESSWLTVSQTCLFLMTLADGSAAELFVECPSVGTCPVFVSQLDKGCVWWGESTEVKCHSPRRAPRVPPAT